MICRLILLCIAVVSCLSLASVASDAAICPAKIEVQQRLASAVDGWAPITDDSPHQLSGITFFDGPPSEKASLVYDAIKKTATEELVTWNFDSSGKRSTWMVCSYSGTAIQLSRGLPPATKSCQVTYSRTQRLAGMPVIASISCK